MASRFNPLIGMHWQDYMASIRGVEENEHTYSGKEDEDEEDLDEADIAAWTVCVGNPFDGMSLEGVFATAEDAVEHADKLYQGEDYYILPICNIGTPEEVH